MFRYPALASVLILGAGPATAQDTTIKVPTVTVQPSSGLLLTAEQEKNWIDKPVYSSDDKKIGEVAAFAHGTDTMVSEMHADIGGFLGIGETRVRLTPAQFKLGSERVTLSVTAAQAKDLPKVHK